MTIFGHIVYDHIWPYPKNIVFFSNYLVNLSGRFNTNNYDLSHGAFRFVTC